MVEVLCRKIDASLKLFGVKYVVVVPRRRRQQANNNHFSHFYDLPHLILSRSKETNRTNTSSPKYHLFYFFFVSLLLLCSRSWKLSSKIFYFFPIYPQQISIKRTMCEKRKIEWLKRRKTRILSDDWRWSIIKSEYATSTNVSSSSVIMFLRNAIPCSNFLYKPKQFFP